MAQGVHPPHVTNYQILSEATADRLAAAVETQIHNGWQPFGPMQIGNGADGAVLMQPMVRYAEFYR